MILLWRFDDELQLGDIAVLLGVHQSTITRTVERIPTFAMAALAGIGAMPDTIEDRAVVIRMRRRAPGESVAPFRHRRDRRRYRWCSLTT